MFACTDLEVLWEAGAGTGKTYGALQKAHWYVRENKGCRVLFLRKTRKSLNESVLAQWEDAVLWPGHPAIVGTATKEHRDYYQFPNGSRIVLGGLDNVDRIMSAQYDLIVVFEANEATLEDWEKLLSRLRNGKGPYHQLIADTNPQSEFHWLNQRALDGRMTRVLGRHEDNPLWYDHESDEWTARGQEYLVRVLGGLTGARRERLLYHRWASEEGLIWEEYDPAIHLVDIDDVPTPKWTFASVDWGTRSPGCMQVWAVDFEDRMWLVEEYYHTKRTIEWWAEMATDVYEKWGPRRFICDHDPDNIAMFNDRIGQVTGRPYDRIAFKATKARKAGWDQVSEGFRSTVKGKASIFLVRDALAHRPDGELRSAMKPTCTAQEIPSYVWRTTKDGQPVKEEPDPTAPDHGCDALRYAAMYLWRRDLSDPPVHRDWKKDSLGAWMEHGELDFHPES